MEHLLSYDCKLSNALDYASGNADRAGDTLDMQGFDGVLMIVKFATIADAATTSIKAQQDSDSAMGTVQDLAGTAQTVAGTDDNDIFYIDLFRPTERYVRLFIDKDAANTTAESAIYIQYRARTVPVTHGTTVNGETHISPAEGTA